MNEDEQKRRKKAEEEEEEARRKRQREEDERNTDLFSPLQSAITGTFINMDNNPFTPW